MTVERPRPDTISDRVLAALELVDAGRLEDALPLADGSEGAALATTASGIWLLGELAARVGDLSRADGHFRTLLDYPRDPDGDPALHGVRPLERLACSALEQQDLQFATIYALRAVRADREGLLDAVSETIRLRTTVFAGDIELAAMQLATLVEAQPASPSARRLAGELAWTRGDGVEALAHWRLGAEPLPPAPSGHGHRWRLAREADAHAWCAAAVGVLNATLGVVPPPVVGRDLESFAGAVVTDLLAGRPAYAPSACRDRIARESVAFIRLLADLGATEALQRVASHAVAYADVFPGIEQLA